MEAEKVDRFLLANEHKFPEYEIPINKLLNLPPEKEVLLEETHFKSPGKMLFISIFMGLIGLDRFLLRDWGKGIGKIITLGGVGFWYIIDWFLIMGATKRKNMIRLEKIITD